MIPQLPPGVDATYNFTQSMPVSVTATIVSVALFALVGWVAWCIAWAYVEEKRADAKRPLVQPWSHVSPGFAYPEPGSWSVQRPATASRPRRKGKKL